MSEYRRTFICQNLIIFDNNFVCAQKYQISLPLRVCIYQMNPVQILLCLFDFHLAGFKIWTKLVHEQWRYWLCTLTLSVLIHPHRTTVPPMLKSEWGDPGWYSTVQYSTVQYRTVQYSTVQYSTVQYRTVQYSTVQYSTVQYSTVQYSTVQYSHPFCSEY